MVEEKGAGTPLPLNVKRVRKKGRKKQNRSTSLAMSIHVPLTLYTCKDTLIRMLKCHTAFYWPDLKLHHLRISQRFIICFSVFRKDGPLYITGTA